MLRIPRRSAGTGLGGCDTVEVVSDAMNSPDGKIDALSDGLGTHLGDVDTEALANGFGFCRIAPTCQDFVQLLVADCSMRRRDQPGNSTISSGLSLTDPLGPATRLLRRSTLHAPVVATAPVGNDLFSSSSAPSSLSARAGLVGGEAGRSILFRTSLQLT